MAVDSLYDSGRQKILEGSIAYLTDTIKCALVKSAYSPNLATHDFWDDVNANVIGTPQALGSKTSTAGVADAADVTFTSVTTGDTVGFVVLYKDTGTASTSPLIALITGKVTVTCAAAVVATDTSMKVDPLLAALPSGATLAMSGGTTVTLSGAASAGARSVSITSSPGAVAAGETAEGAYSSGLPVNTNGGNINIVWDNGANKIFKL